MEKIHKRVGPEMVAALASGASWQSRKTQFWSQYPPFGGYTAGLGWRKVGDIAGPDTHQEMLTIDPHPSVAIDPASPRRPVVLPRFKYDVPKIGGRPHGRIKVGYDVVHTIEDMSAFYAALGYDTSAKDSRLAEEVFVWQRYTRDGSKMSRYCLQVQIAIYLRTHASKFMEPYRLAYEAMLGKCSSHVLDGNDRHCANCPMHPHSGPA